MGTVYVKKPDNVPMYDIWTMAIRECENLGSPLQQLYLNEVVMEDYDIYTVVK